jgi:hypothetical protein
MTKPKKLYSDFFLKIRAIVNRHDPIGLLAASSPNDEYDPEVADLIVHFRDMNNEEEAVRITFDIFARSFGIETAGTIVRYRLLAAELLQLKEEARAIFGATI